jgi:hypothetical protein
MLKKPTYKLQSKVWIYPGMAGWHFANVPKKQSKEIKNLFGAIAGGWGSLPVMVTVGKTQWKTSIFPDKNSATYLLPLKAEIEIHGRTPVVLTSPSARTYLTIMQFCKIA